MSRMLVTRELMPDGPRRTFLGEWYQPAKVYLPPKKPTRQLLSGKQLLWIAFEQIADF